MIHRTEEETTTTLHTMPPPAVHRQVDGARVVVLSGLSPRRTYELKSEIIVGRGPDAGLRVNHEGVSRKHARIFRSGTDEYGIEDLGSRNGTLVNGARVCRCTLQFGDEIQLSQEVVLLFTHHSSIEEKLAHFQKMEAIGQLAAGVAHDFNNLLAVVVASLDYIACLPRGSALSNADAMECLEDARTAANQATMLTRELLTFAKPGVPEQGPVDVHDLLREVIQLIRRTLDRSISVGLEAQPDLVIEGDRSRLIQAMMNLCLNARDAMPAGGTLTLRALRAPRLNNVSAGARSLTPDVLIEVEDTGIGMDEDTRKRIFEPFYSTKAGGKGTGLGLATVYGTVRNHGGQVEVESRVGQGTCFRIYLPESSGRTTTPNPLAKTGAEDRGTGESVTPTGSSIRVLLVDDEPLVRRSVRRLLRQAGHEVIAASDGREAIELYKMQGSTIDVVVLDLNMPEMSGEETSRHLREIDPNVKILFLSGYWESDHARQLLAEGALGFLEKPSNAAALRNAILAAQRQTGVRTRR